MVRNGPRPQRGTGRPPAEQEKVRLTVPLAGRQNVAVTVYGANVDAPAAMHVVLGRAQPVFMFLPDLAQAGRSPRNARFAASPPTRPQPANAPAPGSGGAR